MLVFEVLTPLSFTIHMRDHHHGQSDMTLIARDVSGHEVGHLDYSKWRDTVAVQMITADQRGFGVGPALVRQLQADHPDTEIDFGLLTDDGARMLAKLPTTFTPNPDYVAKHERYAQLKAQDAEWMALSDKLYQTHQIEAYRTMGREIGDRWNALHDEVSELEHELGGLKPGKRLIVI